MLELDQIEIIVIDKMLAAELRLGKHLSEHKPQREELVPLVELSAAIVNAITKIESSRVLLVHQ
jgi:hypothetical protein